MFDVDISKGYVDMPVPEGIDLVSEIERMKREKNAVVLAHYYQSGDLQDIADYVGDSLALAQWAAKTDASILVLCGVHFMGDHQNYLSRQESTDTRHECRVFFGRQLSGRCFCRIRKSSPRL